jgi:hypothetical protein
LVRSSVEAFADNGIVDEAGAPAIDNAEILTLPLWIAAIATVLVIGVAIALWFYIGASRLDDLDHIGAFIGGMANVAVIFWLAGTLLVQGRELALQRHELAMQRRVWQRTNRQLHHQVYLSLQNHLLDNLSYVIRALILVLNQGALISALYGVSDTRAQHGQYYLELLLENEKLQEVVRKSIKEHDHVVIHYVQNYMKLSDRLRTLLESPEFPAEFRYILFDETIFAQVRELLSAMLSS